MYRCGTLPLTIGTTEFNPADIDVLEQILVRLPYHGLAAREVNAQVRTCSNHEHFPLICFRTVRNNEQCVPTLQVEERPLQWKRMQRGEDCDGNILQQFNQYVFKAFSCNRCGPPAQTRAAFLDFLRRLGGWCRFAPQSHSFRSTETWVRNVGWTGECTLSKSDVVRVYVSVTAILKQRFKKSS